MDISKLRDFFDCTPDLQVCCIHNALDDTVEDLKGELHSCNAQIKSLSKTEAFESKGIRLIDRAYEYMILGDVLHLCKDQENLLKKCFNSLETTAHILILASKDTDDKWQIMQMLEAADFVAIGDIDIYDEYHVITAKKLVMWCGS